MVTYNAIGVKMVTYSDKFITDLFESLSNASLKEFSEEIKCFVS